MTGRLAGGVRITPDIAGTYRAVLEIGDDIAHPLPPATAHAVADSILAAVAAAEYDAAVLRQWAHIADDGGTLGARLVAMLRRDRPPIDWPTPLTLEPCISARTGRPFLTVHIAGTPVGHWALDDARALAVGVLEAVAAADLDSAYLRALRTLGGVDENCRAAVADLEQHRDENIDKATEETAT